MIFYIEVNEEPYVYAETEEDLLEWIQEGGWKDFDDFYNNLRIHPLELIKVPFYTCCRGRVYTIEVNEKTQHMIETYHRWKLKQEEEI